ncbi:MAG: hypothetical protein M3444_17470 [Acidobacteriota bacterium]|nr:hypothetical protein [Acidobacteriota bacterium]MDQ5835584.1 hypothetical protein [Acidobacteriota bacterium]
MLERLKVQLGEKKDEDVVRKALALLAQVVEISGDQRYFTITTPDDQMMTVKID